MLESFLKLEGSSSLDILKIQERNVQETLHICWMCIKSLQKCLEKTNNYTHGKPVLCLVQKSSKPEVRRLPLLLFFRMKIIWPCIRMWTGGKINNRKLGQINPDLKSIKIHKIHFHNFSMTRDYTKILYIGKRCVYMDVFERN